MKNKRIFMLLLIAGLFVIMLFTKPNDVQAADTYNTSFNFIKVTNIERWTSSNDLVFRKVEDWGGDSTWYTKKVYLSTTSNPDFSTDSWKVAEFTNDYDYCHEMYDQQGNSMEGRTLYLIEKYEINLDSADISNLAIGEASQEDYIPTGDYLDFSFDNATIKNNSTRNYKKSESQDSYNVYIEKLFTSSTPDTENRDVSIYAYVKDSYYTKVTSVSRGSILLPIYNLKVDMSASGNMMPAGHFALYMRVGVDGDDGRNQADSNVATSTLGSANGYILFNRNYSAITYSELESVDDIYHIEYRWADSETEINDHSDGYYSLNSDEYSVSSIEASYDYDVENSYVRTISAGIEWNDTAPNGVFNNIIPFAIAGVIAIAGIVMLKKNSIKD